MITKGFYIDDVEHTVTVSGYTGGYPAKINCDPDDGWEGSDWEIEFIETVEIEDGNFILFKEFISAYAKEHCKGDSTKALARVERDCQRVVIEQGDEYEP